MATFKPTASRRALLGAFAAAPIVATVPALAMSDSLPQAVAVERDLDRVIELRKTLAWDESDAGLSAWEEAWGDVLNRVEALPLTPEATRVRAKAVAEIYEDTPLFDDSDTTDFRLIRQIVRALAVRA